MRLENGNQMAEFAPALFLLTTFIVIPCLVGIFIGGGFVVAYLTVYESAQVAAVQAKYSDGVEAAKRKAAQITNSSFAKLVRLRLKDPDSMRLYIIVTNCKTGKKLEFGPNIPLLSKVDLGESIYQIEARGEFALSPLISGGEKRGVAFVTSPLPISITVRRPVEYPAGLVTVGRGNLSVTQLY